MTYCESAPKGNLRGGLASREMVMSARLTVNEVSVSRQMEGFKENKHTLGGVPRDLGRLVNVAHFVGRAVRGIIARRQWAIDHVPLGPLRPYASRLDGDNFDVPFGEKFFVEALAESFEGCDTFSGMVIFRRETAIQDIPNLLAE